MAAPRRILLPTVYDTHGGSTRVLLAAAKALRLDHAVTVRAPVPEADERVQALFPSRPLVGLPRKLAMLPQLVRLIATEAIALRRLRPDVIHVHDEPSLYVYGLAARTLRPRPFVLWHLHMDAGHGLAARMRVRLADAAVIISGHAGAPNGLPHTLIRNPLGAHRPPAFGGDRAARLASLGVVGAIDPRKGQDLAIRALAALRRLPEGEGARLILVGPVLDPAFAESLRRQADELGLVDAVVFAGPRPADTAFAGIGLALFPSRAENQPLALAEALAGGLPVVASDIPAHRTMLEEAGADRSALSAREPDAFAAAILTAARNPPSPAIRARVESLYASERFATPFARSIAASPMPPPSEGPTRAVDTPPLSGEHAAMAAPPQADPVRADAPASGRDGLLALAVAGLVVLTVAIGALAPGQAAKPAPAAALSPENDPACAEWSDGCHVCRRLPDGAACSLTGIACTPGAFACLRRTAGP